MELMNVESNILSPCSKFFCLRVKTAKSELALLLDSFAVPPFAAMHKSSSDNMLAAVIEDMLNLELVSLQPVPSLTPEPAGNWVRNSNGSVPFCNSSQCVVCLDYPLPQGGS